jgi:hypothetical protein
LAENDFGSLFSYRSLSSIKKLNSIESLVLAAGRDVAKARLVGRKAFQSRSMERLLGILRSATEEESVFSGKAFVLG